MSNQQTSLRFISAAFVALIVFVLFPTCFTTAGCRAGKTRSGGDDSPPQKLSVVYAPESGEVHRVLVSEGISVKEGAALVEIKVPQGSSANPPLPGAADRLARDRNAAHSSIGQDVAGAEAEVQRIAVEVARVAALVGAGAAPQSQLQAAEAQYQQAQQQLQQINLKADSARRALTVQQGSDEAAAEENSSKQSSERITTARVSAAGMIRVISVRRGQRVAKGQAPATVSPDAR